MARFYGSIQGARGEATRLGHRTSGFVSRTMSYNGDVRVSFQAGKDDHEDIVSVQVSNHNSGGQGVTLYYGDVAKLLKGGRLAAMEYLIRGASKTEKAKLATMLASKALKDHFGGDDT